MNTLLETIHDKKKQLDQYKPFPKVLIVNLDEWYKIELTYTSNAIEGNTLTRQETAMIVEKGITVEGKSITEHLEATNHAKAYEYIRDLHLHNIGDITERIILDIHAIILRNIDTMNAGVYRNIPVRIAGSTVALPNPLKVPELMREFIVWLQKFDGDPVETAIEAHFKLVSIHPFTDGNGRTARLLMNLILMSTGYPPAIIGKEDRKQYIDSIEKGQLKGDLSDYYPFMLKSVEKSLDIYLEAFEPKEKKRSLLRKLMRIGEIAKTTNETISTIRFWTKEGLLKIAKLSPGGYQLYSQDTIERIRKIRKLKKEKRLRIKELKQAFSS
jgi:Fic family protein